jgi:hypothetical protein
MDNSVFSAAIQCVMTVEQHFTVEPVGTTMASASDEFLEQRHKVEPN